MKTNSPTHEEIAHRAKKIWLQTGSPLGQDTEIWLEAEQQLVNPDSTSGAAPRTTSESKSAVKLAEKIETESVVEHTISPAIADEAAIQAKLQKKEARTPKLPTKIAPKAAPPESGKPVWSKPHSS